MKSRRPLFLYLWLLGPLIFFAIGPLGPAPAFAATRCPAPGKPPRVNIKTVPARIIYKTGYSRSDLLRMQRKNGRPGGAAAMQVLGLTLSEFRYSLETAARLYPASGGGYCAQAVSYDLSVGFSDFLVHIDRQYRRGSCEFNAIRDHEISHVALFRSNFTRYIPLIRAKARAAAALVKPVAVRSSNDGVKQLQDQMQRRIGPLIKKLSRDSDIANARIDTPKSYRNVHMLCDNW